MNHFSISSLVETIPEAASLKFSVLAAQMKNQGKDVIILSRGEAFFQIPQFSFEDLPFERGYHYSDPQGIIELRKRISNYYLKTYKVSSNPESEVLISAGSKILLFMSLAVLLNPGEEVILLEPSWVSYPHQSTLLRAVSIFIPHYEKIENIEKYITPKTRVIIINNPNNPSGKVYSYQDLQTLSFVAQKYHLYIIADESYSDFVSREPFISMGAFDQEKQYTIIVNSFSKNFGLSGWRIGYLIANSEILRSILTLNQHLITCPSTILSSYIERYFDKLLSITKPQIKNLMQLREETSLFMDAIGLQYLPGSATFYFCVSIAQSKFSSDEFSMKFLQDYFVAVVPGSSYGESMDRFVRISIGTEAPERIKRGLSALSKMIQETCV